MALSSFPKCRTSFSVDWEHVIGILSTSYEPNQYPEIVTHVSIRQSY